MYILYIFYKYKNIMYVYLFMYVWYTKKDTNKKINLSKLQNK